MNADPRTAATSKPAISRNNKKAVSNSQAWAEIRRGLRKEVTGPEEVQKD